MSKFVLTDAVLTVDGTNISDHTSSVTVENDADEVDVSSFGPSRYREFLPGMRDATITAEIFQDYAAASTDAVLYPLHNSGGTFAVTVKPTSAATSSTNPIYSMTARLYSYSPINGGVGDANTTDIVMRNAGTAGITRATV